LGKKKGRGFLPFLFYAALENLTRSASQPGNRSETPLQRNTKAQEQQTISGAMRGRQKSQKLYGQI
jgi:hypothetical protein